VHITARHDYGVQAMLTIAAAEGRLVTTAELAAGQGIPTTYVAALLLDLRKAALLSSRAGIDGGYALARPAAAISVGDVMRAVSGALSSVRGRPAQSILYIGHSTALSAFWQSVQVVATSLLDSTTLQDLLDRVPQRER
jgi:Rrf2 family protein